MTRTAPRQSRILDRHGKPLNYGLYPSPRTNPKAYKPRFALSNDTKQNVSEWDRYELVNYSRQLYATIDVLSAAIEQKNNWAFGDAWEPHFMGEAGNEDAAWAEEAREFLELQFYPNCNVRGPTFDMRRSLKLMGKAWDRDGDDLLAFTETESGFPQFALYPSTRIGTYGANKFSAKKGEEVKGGGFDGAKISDGIIYNRNNRMIGARILNDDGKHTDLSAFQCDLGFEPDWCDQFRGIPRVATSLLRWMDLQDIDAFIQAGVKRASGISLKVKVAEGEAGMGNEVITTEDSPTSPESERKVHYEETQGGEMWYLDSLNGEDIEQLDYKNPHPNTEAFITRVQRGSISSVGWFYDLLNPGDTGRAGTRAMADLVNQTIWDRQSVALRRWKRIIGYALAKGAKSGFLRKPKNPKSYALWEPGLPAKFTVDAGNDAKISIEKMKFGTSTKSIESAKDGYHADAIARKRLQELKRNVSDAKELLKEFGPDSGITIQHCLEMVEQRSPNPVIQQQQQSQQSDQ